MATVLQLTDGSTINWNFSTSSIAEVTLGGNNHTLNITNDVEGDQGYLFVKQPSNNHYNIKVQTGDIIAGGDGTTTIALPAVNGSKVLLGFIHWKSTWRIWTVSQRTQ